jgi:hypothetical protein
MHAAGLAREGGFRNVIRAQRPDELGGHRPLHPAHRTSHVIEAMGVRRREPSLYR